MTTAAPDLSEAKRRLLQQMLRGGKKAGARAVDPITPRAEGVVPPISPEQLHVWLHAAMAPNLPLYNEPITIHRKGAFDLDVMTRAINEILRRHEIWRTAFQAVDGAPMLIVHPELRIALELIDLTGLPAAAREDEALRIATEEARKPFDLGRVPLFRAKVLKLAADEHRLYLTLHHIIFDGVSIYRVLVPELAAIYDAFARGEKPALAEPALQYGDYAAWRAHSLSDAAMARQMAHWRRALAGPLPVLQLPTDHPRPAMPSYRGSMETFTLPAALTETLKQVSRQEGATLYMTLLAGFKVLLHRYTGQDDILVGGVTDTRRRPELEGLMGYFLNTLALRTHPTGDLTFRAFLAQTRDTVLGALDASDVPFDRIVRDFVPRRDLSVHPLYQVLFSIEPPVPPFAPGWDLTQMDVTIGAAKFDLYFELDERPGEGMVGRILYSSDLFEAATIRRMIDHWLNLLEAVAVDPDCRLRQIVLLGAAEKRRLLVDWNQTKQDVPSLTLHEAIAAQARRSPTAVAVECEGASWTYQALDRRAGEVAAALRQAGIGPGTLVAIAMDRSLEMMAGLLGILMAGAAYLPLDPGFPPQRLALILDDARADAVLTQRSLVALLPPSSVPRILCDEIAAGGPRVAPPRQDDGEALAYVLYTSGSTGRPKGVEVPHRAVVNLLMSMQRAPGFTARDSLLAVTTLSFDIAALELFLPLISGGKVILASRETATDPLRLMAQMASSGCTVMQATPATWRGLIDAGWAGRPTLKILCGGEGLPRDLADALLSRGASLWNMYGPTETTIWSTLHRVARDSAAVPIGRPIANTGCYILDKGGNLAPIGVAGELLIGGAGLALGYRGRPDLTAERFVTLPAVPGQRLYRTGDLARYRADGTIDCLGRTDNQVKIRGFRIAVEEVEAALETHDAIAAAAVKAWPDRSGQNSLVAYVVARGGAAPEAGALRAFLGQSLPDYMVPSRFVPLDALPMTPNRKVDRNALPEPGREARAALVEPSGEAELKLAAIWRDVLDLDSVGRADNFFDLGGHSLLVAKLLQRIERDFGRRLPMAAIFHAPTLDRLAALAGEADAGRVPRTINLQPNGTKPPLFWLYAGPTFRPLAEAMGTDQPFLGVAIDPGELAEGADAEVLADLAPYLVRKIREAQPKGPYYIGGWCKAGVLAYEVASQLTAQGHKVGLLILAHAPNPVHFKRIGVLALNFSKLRHHLGRTQSLRGRKRWAYALARLRGAVGQVTSRLREGNDPCHSLALYEIPEQAARGYVPKPYPGDVALFQPADRPSVLDYRPGWAEVVTGEFTAYDLPGEHRTMLEAPFVRDMGVVMSAALRRVQTPKAEAVPETSPRRCAG